MSNSIVGQQCSGKVQWFNSDKGFGFIAFPEGEGKDIFVHYSSILVSGYKTLQDGDEVDFVVSEGSGQRLQASQVTVTSRTLNGSGNERKSHKDRPKKK